MTNAENTAFWISFHEVNELDKNRVEELRTMFEHGMTYANNLAKLEGGI